MLPIRTWRSIRYRALFLAGVRDEQDDYYAEDLTRKLHRLIREEQRKGRLVDQLINETHGKLYSRIDANWWLSFVVCDAQK